MGKPPPPRMPLLQRPLKASASTAALILDWATLAALGAATVALIVSTRLPGRKRGSAESRR